MYLTIIERHDVQTCMAQHSSVEDCYEHERSALGLAMHCAECAWSEVLSESAHATNPKYHRDCPNCRAKGTYHWLWACNAEITFDEAASVRRGRRAN